VIYLQTAYWIDRRAMIALDQRNPEFTARRCHNMRHRLPEMAVGKAIKTPRPPGIDRQPLVFTTYLYISASWQICC
jgi:hypothetical protein